MNSMLLVITMGLGLGSGATTPVNDLLAAPPSLQTASPPKILQVYRLTLEPTESDGPLDGLTYPHLDSPKTGSGSQRQLFLVPAFDARVWERL